tara:strand:- start:164 stop:796 length:633 start_codon:yes stop_codon:yes gene_type:complete
MRKNLADLRGQLVVWQGWETNSRYNNTWTCISKATVTPWDYKTPIQKCFTKNLIKVDHFWLIASQHGKFHYENNQYEKLGGIGFVKSYMRKDGSIDYTIKYPIEPRLYCIEGFIGRLNKTFKNLKDKERIEELSFIKELLETHSKQNPTIYSMLTERDEFKKSICHQLEFIKSSYEATNKALKTVKMNGKCKKLDLLRVKKQIKSKSKGF